MNSSSRLE